MAGSVIGIKIADGSFFPVLERSHKGKRKLVLTTVNDEQDSVQIDLFQGDGNSMEGAEYIGSLVVSNIPSAGKGEPEINLIVGIDGEGNLNATATDASTGEYESLSVSLEALDEEMYTLPDFELEDSGLDEAEQLNEFDTEDDFGEQIGEDLGELEEELEIAEEGESISTATMAAPQPAPSEPESDLEEEPIAYSRPAEGTTPRRRGHTLLFIGFMILSLAALAFLVYFVFRMLRGPALPPLEAGLPVLHLALAPLIIPRINRGARRHRTRNLR